MYSDDGAISESADQTQLSLFNTSVTVKDLTVSRNGTDAKNVNAKMENVAYVQGEGNTGTTSFGNAADTFASITVSDGVVNMNEDASVTGDVTVDKKGGMYVKTDKTLTVGGTLTVKETAKLSMGDNAAVTGNVTVTEGGTLNILAAAKDDSAFTTSGTLTITNTGKIDLTGLNLTATPVSEPTYIRLAGAQTIDFAFVSANVIGGPVVAEGFEWTIKAMADSAYQQLVNPVSPVAAAGDGANSLVLMITAIPTTLETTVASASFVGGQLVLTLDPTALDGRDLASFSSIALKTTDSSWASIVTAMEGNGGISQNVDLALQVGDTGSPVAVSTLGIVSVNGYVGEADGTYRVEYIPEPATATLSLLALAGLAARRRRKH